MNTIGDKCECLYMREKEILLEALTIYIKEAESTLERIEKGELHIGSLRESVLETIRKDLPEYRNLRKTIEDMPKCW